MRTVVITGLGASTPLGGDLPTTWSALLAGTSGVSVIEADWAQDLSTRIAAQAAVDPASVMDRVAARKIDRSSQFALVAALEAWADAGLGLDDESTVDPDRLLVSLGTGIGGLHSLLGNWDVQKEKGARRVSPLTIPMLMANAPAANVSLIWFTVWSSVVHAAIMAVQSFGHGHMAHLWGDVPALVLIAAILGVLMKSSGVERESARDGRVDR